MSLRNRHVRRALVRTDARLAVPRQVLRIPLRTQNGDVEKIKTHKRKRNYEMRFFPRVSGKIDPTRVRRFPHPPPHQIGGGVTAYTIAFAARAPRANAHYNKKKKINK